MEQSWNGNTLSGTAAWNRAGKVTLSSGNENNTKLVSTSGCCRVYPL